jgi:hypothetical protein
MWIDAMGNLWITAPSDLVGVLVVVLGLFAVAHLSIVHESIPNPASKRLGEYLVRAEMLTNRQLYAKPLRFSSRLRFNATRQHARIQEVMGRNNVPGPSLNTADHPLRYGGTCQTDKRGLYNRRRQLIADPPGHTDQLTVRVLGAGASSHDENCPGLVVWQRVPSGTPYAVRQHVKETVIHSYLRQDRDLQTRTQRTSGGKLRRDISANVACVKEKQGQHHQPLDSWRQRDHSIFD